MPLKQKDLNYDENLDLFKWKENRKVTGYSTTIKGQEEAYLAGFEAALKSASMVIIKILRDAANEIEATKRI